MRGCNNQRYYIEAPDGTLLIPPGNIYPEKLADGEGVAPKTGDDKVWRWAKASYLANKEKIVVKRVRSSNIVDSNGAEVKWNVFVKTYLNDVIKDATAKPNALIEDHINQNSSHELNELGIPFSFAKPSSLIGYLCEITRTRDEDVVLDFFAGSGTTGHAVYTRKVAENTNLHFILVQLPEKLDIDDKDQKEAASFCDKLNKPRNIAEVCKERLRRAANKIKAENPMFTGDLGFRVFKLDSSNIRAWEPHSNDLPKTLEESVDHLKMNRTEPDILYELLLKLGLDLCVPIEQMKIAGKTVHSIGAGVLLTCLAEKITREDVEPLAQGIIAWHKKLAPAGETACVFCDAAFADDVAKTNLAAILYQNGLTNVRSL